jgi:hypothetical protein
VGIVGFLHIRDPRIERELLAAFGVMAALGARVIDISSVAPSPRLYGESRVLAVADPSKELVLRLGAFRRARTPRDLTSKPGDCA